MNGKKVNWIFLIVVFFNITTIVLLSVLYPVFQLGMVPNLILSQLIVLLPAAIGVLLAKENPIKLAGFHKIKMSSVFMIILFTFLCMPLITLINAISMLFVDNAVASMSSDILGTPFMAMFLLMGILGPLNEELVCRGIFYQSYKRSGTMLQAMLLSAMLFALICVCDRDDCRTAGGGDGKPVEFRSSPCDNQYAARISDVYGRRGGYTGSRGIAYQRFAAFSDQRIFGDSGRRYGFGRVRACVDCEK